MDLPVEIRLEILAHSTNIPTPIDAWMFPRRYRGNIAPTTMVCRQLRNEAEEVFYKSNTFRHKSFPTDTKTLLDRWLHWENTHPFPRRIRPMIRYLELLLVSPVDLSSLTRSILRDQYQATQKEDRALVTLDQAVGRWICPLTTLKEDGFTKLATFKVSFMVLGRVDRNTVQRVARRFVTRSQISAAAVDINWDSMLRLYN